MPNVSMVPQDTFWLLFLLALFWPGYAPASQPDRPKKGYWTVGSTFWPLRRAYADLPPDDQVLLSGFRNTMRLALLIALAVDLLARNQAVVQSMPPHWQAIEIGVLAILVGRASGFWSAGRRIRRTDTAIEPEKDGAR